MNEPPEAGEGPPVTLAPMTSPTVWFTSDQHWGHANIIRFAGRPFADVAEMDEQLIANWNQRVRAHDTVWLLGDVALGDTDRFLRRLDELAGTKHLVAGNHDRLFRRDRTTVRERWERRYHEAGFASIHHGDVEIELTPTCTVRAAHFPYEGDSHDRDRYVEHRPVDDGRPLLHGHTHGHWRKRGHMIDVGVDAWAGFPVDAPTLAALFEQGPTDLEPLPWQTDPTGDR